MTILRASPGAHTELVQLYQGATAEMNANGIPQWDELYPSAAVLQTDLEQQQLYIGKMDNEIACAFVLNHSCDPEYADGLWAYPERPFLVLHRLCVHPKFQQQGLAKRAMQEVEPLVQAQGYRALRLDVFSQNPYALRLYRQLGYQEVGTVRFRKGTFFLMERYWDEPGLFPQESKGLF